jgi:hypothetical protein
VNTNSFQARREKLRPIQGDNSVAHEQIRTRIDPRRGKAGPGCRQESGGLPITTPTYGVARPGRKQAGPRAVPARSTSETARSLDMNSVNFVLCRLLRAGTARGPERTQSAESSRTATIWTNTDRVQLCATSLPPIPEGTYGTHLSAERVAVPPPITGLDFAEIEVNAIRWHSQ